MLEFRRNIYKLDYLRNETSCEEGMDVCILLDYTGSMTAAINNLKNTIQNLITEISNTVGNNNYRLSLVIFDEYGKRGSTQFAPYSTLSPFYSSLPTSQKRIITTGETTTQWITCLEPFNVNNNETSFLNALDVLITDTFPIGGGYYHAEPSDIALDLIINDDTFNGSFRPNVAKYLILLTDAPSSGTDDLYTAGDDDVTLDNIASQYLTQKIKPLVYTVPEEVSKWESFTNTTNGILSQNLEIITASQISSDLVASCDPILERPSADAGEDIITDSSTVSLDGSNSIGGSTPIRRVEWFIHEAPNNGFTITQNLSYEAVLGSLVKGVYKFKLEVETLDNLVDADLITVVVKDNLSVLWDGLIEVTDCNNNKGLNQEALITSDTIGGIVTLKDSITPFDGQDKTFRPTY